MTVALTSVMAFHDTKSEREIQAEMLLGVYEKHGAMSDRKASYHLGWYPSQVSARRNSLMADGKVVEMSKQRDPDTGKTVNVYGINKPTLF